jgi:hypothetical protein
MSQQNIDFGSFPDDPDADAIRTAFSKVQNNFTELYATTTSGTVTSVNQSAGAGIQVTSPTGNVIVTANIACVQVATSSLSIGQGGNGGTSATITQSSQTLVIDINPANVFSANFAANSTGGLANFYGTLTVSSNSQPNITSVGTLTSLAVTGNITSGNVYANSGTVGAGTLIGTLNANSNSQPNITTIGTLGNLNVTSNSNLGNLASANFFSGDGYLLSNLTITAGSSILNGSSNVVVAASGNVTTSVAGNSNILTVTGTGANIAGTLNATGALSITGNANVANLGTGLVIASGNVSATQLISNIATGTAPFVVTSTTQVANLNVANAGLAAYATVANSVALSNVSGAGNIASINLNGNGFQILYGNGVFGAISSGSTITNGNSNVSVAANGDVTTSVAGNSNILTVTGTGVNVTGTLNVTSTISGNFNGNVTNATQGNITSLGNLTSLKVNGVSNLGPVGNVIITGGGSGFFLQTNGSGNLSWNNATLVPAPGNTSEVIYNNLGNYAASSTITANGSNGYLSATTLSATTLLGALGSASNVQSNIKQVGTLDYLTINTTGYLAMGSGNITAGNINLIAAGSANLGNSTTANYFIGNFYGTANSATTATTAGTVTTAAQGNITSVGTLTSLNSSGNITAPSHIANTGYFVRSVSASVSAAGTVQGNATALTTEFNRVSTVASGSGVVLPTATAGMSIVIVNSSANTVLVYPAAGAAINSLATNVGYNQVTLATLQYIAISSTQWYTVGASYA